MPRRRTTIGRNPFEVLPEAVADRATRPSGAPPAEAVAAGGRVLDAWARGADAVLLATLEAQNATMAAGLSVVEATAGIHRATLEEWAAMGSRAQAAALETFRATLQSAAGPGGGTRER